MYKIISRRIINENTKLFEIEAMRIAKKAKPGQFVIFRVDDSDKRVPLTIADFNRERGTVTMVALELGVSTKKLGKLKEGDSILDFVGPLGQPTHIENFGRVVCIGGGTGIAAIYPIARGMQEQGNEVTTIIGARNEKLLFFEEELQKVSDNMFVMTDDGSRGEKGLVTNALNRLIDSSLPPDLVIAVGPVVMMRAVAETTRAKKIKTVASLNPIMVDGTGMCGGCRVTVGSEVKFACVDGPEFDAHLVDFDNLIQRLGMYKEIEKKASHTHDCKLNIGG